MKFRSETELTVSDSTGMHKAIIGPEWRPLPKVLQAAAIAAGAEVDTGKFKAEEQPQQPGPNAAGHVDEALVIRKAIEGLLATNNDADFTGDGHPKVDAVNAATGMKHTKSDILAVWNVMADEERQKAEAAETVAEQDAK